MPPERSARRGVHRFISAVGVRRWWLHFALSVAASAVAVLALTVAANVAGRGELMADLGAAGALVTGALAMALSHRRRSRAASAVVIETSVPTLGNLVVTAEELERHPGRASALMTTRILEAADAAVAKVRPGDVVPLHWIAGAVSVALLAGALTVPRGQQVLRDAATAAARAVPSPGDPPRVRVRVEPPAYSGRSPVTLDTPVRIEALEGSRLTFEVAAPGRVRFGAAIVERTVIARDSGYFAVESGVSGSEAPASRLIPLNVTPDQAPTVKIDAPGKDLLLPGGDRTIPLTIHAADDLALANLELRYTKVSGTGEQFEFKEGTLPVTLQRMSGREWRGTGALALAALQLGPGDSLVYRAVARDRRPGNAGMAASDTYYVEVAGPGQVALEGVDMPPELERYAMSQQMIVLKIERLQARAARLPRESLVEESAGIAAEQRTVRANFVFLLGGHVEDEEIEAEHSHEIQEGRLENSARKDINAAISHMTRAEEGLTAVDLAAALRPARAAVEALQRAFGRSRYLLRALAVRSRLDPSRRLTGRLNDAGDWRRAREDADPREGEAARRLFERLLDTTTAWKAGTPPPRSELVVLAEAALRIDSTSPVWRDISRRLVDAQTAAALEEVVAALAPQTVRGALPRSTLAQPLSSVERAFQVERRR